MINDFEKRTRSVFHDIHLSHKKSPESMDRLTSLLSTDYLCLDSDFFRNKICLDAGCGSNAVATINMLDLGAEYVYAFDLDDSIYDSTSESLSKYKGSFEVGVGNLLDIPYESEKFDFVHCAGVLHHVSDYQKAISELMRVVKPGGILYIHYYGLGGIVRDITTFFRDEYKNKPKFKNIIDELNVKSIHEVINWISCNNDKKDVFLDELKLLIDKDLVLTVKDRIQAPLYKEFDEEVVTTLLKLNGFSDIKRLTRAPKFNNVRKYLSPFYYYYKHKYSKFLYGSGQVQLRATKPCKF